MIDGEAELVCGRDVLIRAGRLSRQPQHGVAVLQEALRRRVEDVLSEVVECRRAGAGLTTGDADEAAMKRALASRAAETYVLASSEKIGTASPYQVIPLGQASAIITDAPPQSATVQELRARQVEVITASART